MRKAVRVVLILILTDVTTSYYFPPCFQNYFIVETHPLEYENLGSYYIDIRKDLDVGTEIKMNFTNADATLSVEQPKTNLTKLSDTEYKLNLLERTNGFRVFISGEGGKKVFGKLSSVKINGQENCGTPTFGYNKWEIKTDDELVETRLICGRRKINYNQLIVYGGEAKPGDWPWHVALNRIYKTTFTYIGGGTLITDTFVLTAAHCVTKNGIPVRPRAFSVSLGKTDLIGWDKDSQERKVFKVIVHQEFNHKKLDNDIALLKLRTPAVFNDYIQPACLWYNIDADNIPSGEIIGAVAGWGVDEARSLSTNLHHTKMPLVQDITCIRRKPNFYAPFMNGKRFCAGILNGTAPCNGDSGGGFVVYVQNGATNISRSDPTGVWFLRGIVSLAYNRQDDVSVCDPNEYVLFTDVPQYRDWIKDHMK